MNALWNAAALSMGIATMATVLTAILAVPLAFVIGRRKFRGRSVLEGLILLPLVLPPTVVGYLILVVMGRRGFIGTWLYHWFGYSLLMRIEGAVLAAMIVALPLCYMPARAAFAGVDRDIEDAARVCGATTWRLFFRISLPAARRGILAGIVLAFARAMGEFGATLMVYTWQPGHETLPILIYADYEFDHLDAALPAVGVLSLISLVVILLYNRALHRAHDKTL